jgi:hypothetical protein
MKLPYGVVRVACHNDNTRPAEPPPPEFEEGQCHLCSCRVYIGTAQRLTMRENNAAPVCWECVQKEMGPQALASACQAINGLAEMLEEKAKQANAYQNN